MDTFRCARRSCHALNRSRQQTYLARNIAKCVSIFTDSSIAQLLPCNISASRDCSQICSNVSGPRASSSSKGLLAIVPYRAACNKGDQWLRRSISGAHVLCCGRLTELHVKNALHSNIDARDRIDRRMAAEDAALWLNGMQSAYGNSSSYIRPAKHSPPPYRRRSTAVIHQYRLCRFTSSLPC
jgi:hypothetical protein